MPARGGGLAAGWRVELITASQRAGTHCRSDFYHLNRM